jgi:hypothetical protein
MVNVYSESPIQNQEEQNIPLAMLFTDGSFLDETLYKSREQKVQAFVDLCKNTRVDNYSAKEVVDRVVRNALQIEFSSSLSENPDMLEAVTQTLFSDLVLRDEVIEFAQRHFQTIKIDPTLIN